MAGSKIKLLRRLFGTAGLTSVLAVGAAQAYAAEPAAAPASDTEALRAQVRELAAMVQSVSQHDQDQIQALSAQVKALQTQLAQATANTPSGPVLATQSSGDPMTRAAQNATGQVSIPGRVASTESSLAIPRVVQNASNRFALQSADGEYSIGFTGDIQFDTGDYLNYRADSKYVGPQSLSNGVNARRARIGVAGTAFGSWGYAFVYDGGNSADQTPKGIETAQIVYGGLRGAAFEIGYSSTYFTLDQATSANDTLFMERATPSNIAINLNAGDFRANAGARFFGDRYWAGAYVTGPAAGDSHTLTAERLGAFQRVAVQAISGHDYSLHLGVGVDELLQAPNTGPGTANAISLSDQPELRIDPTTLINTGNLGTLANPVTKAYVFDLESAAAYHNLFWQGEYYHYEVDRRGLTKAAFDGGYGEVSWTLTGETHRYNPQAGSYYRISPRDPFSLKQGGIGAWEIAGRITYIDLDSNFVPGQALATHPAAVDGGSQTGYTLGLNWYPNDFIRLLLDYNHVNFDKANGAAVKGAALGVPVGVQFDALSLRVQVSY